MPWRHEVQPVHSQLSFEQLCVHTGVPVQSRLQLFRQLWVQVAESAQVTSQLLEQVLVQVAPAKHSRWQLERQSTSQVAPGGQATVQLPPAHEAVQSPVVLQSISQLPPKQLRSQVVAPLHSTLQPR